MSTKSCLWFEVGKLLKGGVDVEWVQSGGRTSEKFSDSICSIILFSDERFDVLTVQAFPEIEIVVELHHHVMFCPEILFFKL